MTPEEEQQAEEARRFVRANRRLLIEKFANLSTHPSVEHPITVFMAGAPGSGKTELSKRIMEGIIKTPGHTPVRIDADEIREMIPGYTGANSHVFQGASARGVEILYDYALDHDQHVILDGTFALKEKSFSNIERALHRDRSVEMYYIFQDPRVAWDFTKKREAIEHRNVSKEVFVRAFFAAHDNVMAAKKQYADHIQLNVVIKDIRSPADYQAKLNVADIDQLVPWDYDQDKLSKELP